MPWEPGSRVRRVADGVLREIAAGRIDAAESRLKTLPPDALPRTRHALAQAFVEAGALRVAERLYRQLRDAEPRDSGRHYDHATVLRMVGDLAGASAATLRALELDPEFIEAFHLLTDLDGRDCREPWLNRFEALARSARLDPEREVRLHYALGAARDRRAEYDRAFEHLLRGGRLARSRIAYRVEDDLAVIDALVRTHRPARLEPAVRGAPTRGPVFVVGLPRSGTTLIEQLLLRAPETASAGETAALSLATMEAGRRDLSPRPSSRLDLVERAFALDLPTLGADYLRRVKVYRGAAARLIDKTPFNFLYAALILAALPDARIVMLRRDPRDSIAGIFRTHFGGLYPYSYDPMELAHYVAAFNRLADHWRSVLPDDRYFELQYERFVSEPSAQGRALFAFVGLSWDESRLDAGHHRIATTASAAQVRQPISSAHRGAWRHYEPWLKGAYACVDAWWTRDS